MTDRQKDVAGSEAMQRAKQILDGVRAGQEALKAIKDYLEWGPAKTSSDRELFEDRFRQVLKDARLEFKEPE